MNDLQQAIEAKFPLFEKGLVDEILETSDIRSVNPGDIMMRTGQYIRSTMLVLDGLFKIYREDEEGNEFFMYYLDGGKACALSLYCGAAQEKSEIKAKADTIATIISIPITISDTWFLKYKSWNEFALSSYRQRFEELLQTIDHVAFRNMDERLMFYLKRHQEKLQSNNISISITDIASELNSSREVVSRLLKKMSEKGLVKLHRSHIEVLNLDTIMV